jgi:hypothetical protein
MQFLSDNQNLCYTFLNSPDLPASREVAGRRDQRRGDFFIFSRHNQLKSPDSDE